MKKTTNIYGYKTDLIKGELDFNHIQKKYHGSVLQRSTALAKNCGAFYDPRYTVPSNQRSHIKDCGSNPLYTKLVTQYYKELQNAV